MVRWSKTNEFCKLKYILFSRDISQKEFAKKAKLGTGTVSMICKGQDVRMTTAMKVVHTLKIPAEEIWPWLGNFRKESK